MSSRNSRTLSLFAFALSLLVVTSPTVSAGDATLTRSGGVLGTPVTFDLEGDIGELYYLKPSFSGGPIPLADGRHLDIGIDLLGLARVNFLDGSGLGSESYNLPVSPNLQGRALHAQFITIPGPVIFADDISNPVSLRLTAPLNAVDTVAGVGTPRQGHTATTLGDGTVLIAGGDEPDMFGVLSPRDTLELFDPQTQKFTTLPVTMQHARSTHTATLMSDGKVLLLGGYDETETMRSTGDLYDPVTGTVTSISAMSEARTQHSATLLADGRVFVVGGSSKFDLSDVLGSLAEAKKTSEVYDPVSNGWTNGPSIPYVDEDGLIGHSATLLGNDKVLIAGGVVVDIIFVIPVPAFTNACWLFDPGSMTFSATGAMANERVYHGGMALPGGNALVAGGADGDFVASSFFTRSGCEIYDYLAGTWSSAGSLNDPRAYPNMVDLGSGIAIVGGLSSVNVTTGTGVPEQTIETAPYAVGAWSAGGEMQLPREVARGVPIDGGERILVVGVGDNGVSGVDTTAETYVP